MLEKITEKLTSRFGNINMVPLTGGYTNLAFLLEGTHPLLVAKITSLSSGDTLNEISSLKLLQGSGITPEIYDVMEVLDKKVVLIEYRNGVNSQTILDLQDWEKAIQLYKNLGEFLALNIHSIRFDSKGRGIRTSNIKSLQETNLHLDFVPYDLVIQSKEIFSMIDDDEKDWVLTHGDYGVHNTLIGEMNDLTVLDWEWSEWANPLTDIAWVCWFTRLHYPEKAKILNNAFLNGYLSHRHITILPESLKYYSLYKVWNILNKIQKAPSEVQQEWLRRLEWTLKN